MTWAAYSSAGSAQSSLTLSSSRRSGFPPPGSHGAPNPIADVEAAGGVKEWKAGSGAAAAAPGGSGAAKEGSGEGAGGAAGAYQSVASTTSGGGAGGAAAAGASATDAEYAEDEKPTNADRRPWLFHVIMALGGLYMGMALTNWGEPQAT